MVLSVKKVLVSDPVHGSCIRILEDHGISVTHGVKLTPEQLQQQIKEYDGLIVRSETKVTKAVLEAGAPRLRLVGRAGTGVDNIDIPAATNAGVYVLNTPGGNSISACELTCALISALARNVGGGVVSMKEGRWDRKQFMGNELYGKTLGVVGLGRIGREVAYRMISYGMNVVGFDPLVSGEDARNMGVTKMDLDDLWPVVDYVTLHVPLNQHTKDLINEKSLSKCKRGVKIVNVARGGIVHETDLLNALNSGQCGGAALDVYSEEPPKSQHIWDLIKHPKVLPTPHLGASTEEAQVRVAEEIAQQFVALANPNSGFQVGGAINSGVLSALSDPSNSALAQLARSLGSFSAKLVTTSSKPSLHIHSLAQGGERRWLVDCVLEGFVSKSGPGVADLAKSQMGDIKYVHSKQDANKPSDTSLTLQISTGSEQHVVTGSVRGDTAQLVSVDGANFMPAFPLSPRAQLVSTHNPHQTISQLFLLPGKDMNPTSVGVAKGKDNSWICSNYS